ncbi:MAG TPA: alpha/beta fold hydrolase [Gammaproteobacteria bacterium]|nr:alpha/beta fold hydrolase [Gammaproteobacteria bacterium]
MTQSGQRTAHSTAAEIAGPAGVLEAALDSSARPAVATAVVCHPHPLQDGTMRNKVVTTLSRAFTRLGADTVRFNFRGVGASAGSYADGIGERDDALAVVAWCRARWPQRRVYLGGFSFGGAVAAAIAARAAPAGLVTVAPAVDRLARDFAAPSCPWLLVHGDADDVVPPQPVVDWAATLATPPRVVLLPGVGHFFHGRLPALIDAVTDFFGADFAAAGGG